MPTRTRIILSPRQVVALDLTTHIVRGRISSPPGSSANKVDGTDYPVTDDGKRVTGDNPILTSPGANKVGSSHNGSN